MSKDLIPARLDTAGPLALVTFVCCRVHHAIFLSFGGGAGRDLCPQDRGQGRRLRNSPCSFHRQRGLDLRPFPRVGEAGLKGTPKEGEKSGQGWEGSASLAFQV